MECPLNTKEGADLILDYCSDRLAASDPAKAIAFERHLAQDRCEECNRVVTAQRAVWDALDSYVAPAVSADFDEKLWKRIEESEARPWWRKLLDGPAAGWGMSGVSWKPAFVTASACAAVFALMLAIRTGGSGGAHPDAVPAVEKASAVLVAAPVDFDQVEKAIDDIDMLDQLGVVDDPA